MLGQLRTQGRNLPRGGENRDRTLARSLHDMQDNMDRLFDSFFTGVPDFPAASNLDFVGRFAPRVDISEGEKEVEVTCDLPGINKDDVNIRFDNNVLHIEAETKHEDERKDKNYHVVERSRGVFERHIPMNTEIEEDKIEAKMDNGVLTITLPKSEEAKDKTRKIEVK
jgi:HSP20 family protein